MNLFFSFLIMEEFGTLFCIMMNCPAKNALSVPLKRFFFHYILYLTFFNYFLTAFNCFLCFVMTSSSRPGGASGKVKERRNGLSFLLLKMTLNEINP